MDGGRDTPKDRESSGAPMGLRPLTARRGFPEFSELVLACRFHPLKTLGLGLFTSLVFALLASLIVEPTYKAESFVKVRQNQEVVFSAQSSRADDIAFVRSQEQLALSPQVIATALKNTDLQPVLPYVPYYEPADWLRKQVVVDMQSGSEVLSISVTHTVPAVAQAICNALTNAYVAEVTGRLTSDQERRQIELERAAQDADRKLDKLWEELNQVAIQVGSENSQSLTIRDEIQLQAYRDYSQQLRTLQLRGHELQSQVEEAQRDLTDNIAKLRQTESARSLQANSEIATAGQRVELLDEQIRRMRDVVAHDDSPRLQRLLAERTQYADELARITTEVSTDLEQQSLERAQSLANAGLQHLKKQLELNNSEKEFLRSRLAEIDTGTQRTHEPSGLQLDVARHAVDRQARMADGLWQTLEELKIERQSQVRVQLMHLAALPDAPSHLKQLKAIAVVLATCWVIIILGTGYAEWRSCIIRDLASIVENSSLAVYGDIRQSELYWWKNPARSTSLTGAQAAVAQILLSEKQGISIPTLLITSPTSSETRHVLAIEIATAFAAMRRNTLLVDCDSSSDALQRLLNCDTANGWRQASQPGIDLQNLVLRSENERLDFLPLGTGEVSTSGTSDPDALARLLKELRRDYQSMILIGPAMLEAPDSLLCAAQADRIAFAVSGGVSRWDKLVQAESMTQRAGIACFGAIIRSDSPIQLKLLPPAPQPEPSSESTRGSLEETNMHKDLLAIEQTVKGALADQAVTKAPDKHQEFHQ